ncbi:hypothetical protein ESZ50_10975 [Weissella muntiaci]|uniref:Uncharacterized protein n=1 Tax=Weissella muntiaci TaxID=2508881 RepID=A0A6C2C2G0_9LACO|nr:hypothetical protein ESZ50_10975 [Weissella muntiaci]
MENKVGAEIVKTWGKQYSKELNEKQLKVLVTSGEIKKLKFKKKDGEEYTATLELNVHLNKLFLPGCILAFLLIIFASDITKMKLYLYFMILYTFKGCVN